MREFSANNLIGEGKEKKVYINPEKPSVAESVYKPDAMEQTPRQIRARYYLNKIFKLLFPQNIPDIYHSGVKSPQLKTEYIEPDELHKEIQEIMIRGKRDIKEISQTDYERFAQLTTERARDPNTTQLDRKLSRILKPFDYAPANFAYAKQTGNLYYLDNDFVPWIIKRNGTLRLRYDRAKLVKAIFQLEEGSREQALKYFKRLTKLENEEVKEQLDAQSTE